MRRRSGAGRGDSRAADCPAPSAHIDVLPTLAEIARAELPTAAVTQIEGRSLVTWLRDPQARWPDRTLVTHVGRWPRGQAAQSKHKKCSIRNSRFRLVNNRELYDLKNDPGETTNVINEHLDVVAQLRGAYDTWWDEVQPLLVNEDAIGPKINPFKDSTGTNSAAVPMRSNPVDGPGLSFGRRQGRRTRGG